MLCPPLAFSWSHLAVLCAALGQCCGVVAGCSATEFLALPLCKSHELSLYFSLALAPQKQSAQHKWPAPACLSTYPIMTRLVLNATHLWNTVPAVNLFQTKATAVTFLFNHYLIIPNRPIAVLVVVWYYCFKMPSESSRDSKAIVLCVRDPLALYTRQRCTIAIISIIHRNYRLMTDRSIGGDHLINPA